MVEMPTWDGFMAATLRVLQNDGPTTRQELYERVAAGVGLSVDQKAELLPSGGPKYKNRIGWALTSLMKAALVERPVRATYAITEAGGSFLAGHPGPISEADLRAIPAYGDPRKSKVADDLPETSLDPIEQVDDGVTRINEKVGAELIERIRLQEPAFFEEAVVKLIVAMGYGGRDTRAVRTQLTNDAGIDGVIDQDVLGLSRVFVQAKRYASGNAVQRPEIQAFVGALHGKKANHGVFITTGRFSAGAVEYAQSIQDRVVLIDGQRLADLLVRYGVGVHTVRTIEIVEIDEDFFE